MFIDLGPILRGEKSFLKIEYEMTDLPEITDVTFTGSCRVEGGVDNRAGYMTLSLHASLPYVSVCARCAEDIDGVFEVDVNEQLALEGTLNDEDTDDYVIVENGGIDTDLAVSEAVLLEFPMRLLCSEDCAGLCDVCGANLNREKCSCTKKEIDPRLEILTKLLDK